ncbi:hypothetical protein D3C86_1128320 [compost metagenome]
MREHLVQRVDGPPRHARGVEGVRPALARRRRQRIGDHRPQAVHVRQARAIRDVARVGRPFRMPGHAAEARELAVVADRQDQMAVLAGKDLVGRAVRMRVAAAPRRHARHEVIGALVGVQRHGDVQQADVQGQPLPGLVTLAQGGQHGGRGVHAGHQVHHRDPGAQGARARRAVRLAGVAHESAHALEHVVVSGLAGHGAGLAVAGDGQVDQAGIDAGKRVVVQPIFAQAAGLVVFDQDVRIGHQFAHASGAVFGGEIDGDRLLAPVAGHEVGGHRFPAIRRTQVRRPPAAGIVAAFGMFNLDDLRPEVRQVLRAPGAREDARQVHDFDTAQGVVKHMVSVIQQLFENYVSRYAPRGVECFERCVRPNSKRVPRPAAGAAP